MLCLWEYAVFYLWSPLAQVGRHMARCLAQDGLIMPERHHILTATRETKGCIQIYNFALSQRAWCKVTHKKRKQNKKEEEENTVKGVPLVELLYLVFICMPGES